MFLGKVNLLREEYLVVILTPIYRGAISESNGEIASLRSQ
jgi:hypothetical protein